MGTISGRTEYEESYFGEAVWFFLREIFQEEPHLLKTHMARGDSRKITKN